jgi:hypothetical protein
MPRVLASEFPRARYNRTLSGVSPYSEAAGFIMPRTRVWTFHLRHGGAARSTVASPALQGVAVIRDIAIRYVGSISNGPLPIVQLFKALSAGPVGNALALTALPSGQNIFDTSVSEDGQFTGPAGPGLFDQAGAVATPWTYRPLNIVVQDPLFYLNLSVYNNNAGALETGGSVRIYEGVDPALIGSILSG